MKIYLSNYRYHWISPYTIYEKLVFWRKVDILNLSDREEKFIKYLTPISQGILKFLDVVHPRITYVKIDRYDTWDMRSTLAQIVVPMLEQLKKAKHGVPGDFIFDENGKEIPFHKAEKKWDAAMDKMIWSFKEELKDDATDQFFKNGKYNKAFEKYQARKAEGFALFAKHYESLWD